jgi:hypothetical protein
MPIADLVLGFGIASFTFLAIPVIAIAIGMDDPRPGYSRIAWEVGRPIVAVWALGVVCLIVWGVWRVLSH